MYVWGLNLKHLLLISISIYTIHERRFQSSHSVWGLTTWNIDYWYLYLSIQYMKGDSRSLLVRYISGSRICTMLVYIHNAWSLFRVFKKMAGFTPSSLCFSQISMLSPLDLPQWLSFPTYLWKKRQRKINKKKKNNQSMWAFPLDFSTFPLFFLILPIFSPVFPFFLGPHETQLGRRQET